MRALKYSIIDSNKIDLGSKIIYKYPTPTKDFDVARMVVNGRHPLDQSKFILEHTCQFIMYIIKGSGNVYAGDDIFQVEENDIVFVPTNNKFAVEGHMEYITFDIPAFFVEQSEEVVG